MARLVCPYFARGWCRNGSNCRDAHVNSTRADRQCAFYLKGRCRYGASCWFEHSAPDVEPSASGRNDYDTFRGPIGSQLTSSHLRDKASSNARRGNEFESSDISTGRAVSSRYSRSPDESYYEYDSTLTSHHSAGDGFKPSSSSRGTRGNQRKSNVTVLCQRAVRGRCRFKNGKCRRVHGLLCDLCGLNVLHPNDEEQQHRHAEECFKALELATARTERSKNKQCSICLDNVLEKPKARDRKFAILPNCKHIFCVSCISTWRKTGNQEVISETTDEVVRGCPQCRTVSEFFAPSAYWIEDSAEKETFVNKYKKYISTRSCKYYRLGDCPDGHACLYRHDPSAVRRVEPDYENAELDEILENALYGDDLWDDVYFTYDLDLYQFSSDDEYDWY